MRKSEIFLTVDIAVLRKDGSMEILLIKRKNEPFKNFWALPGGFVKSYERIREAAVRELEEETSLNGIDLKFLGIFDNPSRDPRGRVISIAYYGILNEDQKISPGSDSIDAKFFKIEKLPELAFDHNEIISELMKKLSSDNP